MRVLVTGASGRIGTAFIASPPPTDWEVIATDRVAGGGVEVLDVTDPQACRRALSAVDAVVHLAADPSTSADFRTSVLPVNILGTYNIASAAVAAGVRRVVFASSAQAVAGYPLDVQVREDDPPRPVNDYGVGKAFGEALCASMAARSTTIFLSVRIGNYAERRPTADASLRNRMAWLSPRDSVHLLWCALTAAVDGHHVLHGVSDNAAKQLSIEATRRRVGYAPVDDAFASS
jgi:uronate dehydrogenase